MVLAVGRDDGALQRLDERLRRLGDFDRFRLGEHDPLGEGARRRLVFGLRDLDPEARARALEDLNVRRERIRAVGLQLVLYVEADLLDETARHTPDLRAWSSMTLHVPAPEEPRPEARTRGEPLPRATEEQGLSYGWPLGGEHALVGRDTELQAVDAAARRGGLVALVGWPGMGRTALARAWMSRSLDADREVMWWSFDEQPLGRTPEPPTDWFWEVACRWAGVDRNALSPWQRARAVARHVRAQDAVLLLDGLEGLQYPAGPRAGRVADFGLAVLLDELDEDGAGVCLCTVQRPLSGVRRPVERTHVAVGALPAENVARMASVHGDRRDAFRDALEERRVGTFGGSPLAATLVSGSRRLLGGNAPSFASGELAEMPEEEGGPARAVAGQLAAAPLPKPERELLELLSCTFGHAGRRTLEPLVGCGDGSFDAALDNLSSAGLLEVAGSGAFVSMHAVLREAFQVRLRLGDPERYATWHRQLADRFAEWDPATDSGSVTDHLAWAERVAHDAHARGSQAVQDVSPDEAERRLLLRERGYLATSLATLEMDDAVAMGGMPNYAVLRRVREPSEVPADLRGLGRLAEAIEHYRAIRVNEARDSLLGRALVDAGDLHEAFEVFEEARHDAERKGRPDHIRRARHGLALVHLFTGDRPAAARVFEGTGTRDDGLLCTELAADPLLAEAAEHLLGEEAVVQGASRILPGRSETWDPLAEARVVRARASMRRGRLAEARQHLDAPLRTLRGQGHLVLLSRALLVEAELLRREGHDESALHVLDEVEAMARFAGLRLVLADVFIERARMSPAGPARELARSRARELMERTGYLLRADELEQLEGRH